MPIIAHRTYDKVKASDEMLMKMKHYIIRERERRKQEIAEGAALINKRKEQKRQDEEDSHSLEQIRAQIRELEDKAEALREEKHKLFIELKKVLNQEEEDKRVARQREQEEAERRRNEAAAPRNTAQSLFPSSYLHPGLIPLQSIYGGPLSAQAFTTIPGQLSFGQLGLGGHGQSGQLSMSSQHASLGLGGMQNSVGQLGLVGQPGQLDLVSQNQLGHVSQSSLSTLPGNMNPPTSQAGAQSHSATSHATSMRQQSAHGQSSQQGHLLVPAHGAHMSAQSAQPYSAVHLGLTRPQAEVSGRPQPTLFQSVLPLGVSVPVQLGNAAGRQTVLLPLAQPQSQPPSDDHASSAKRPKTEPQAPSPVRTSYQPSAPQAPPRPQHNVPSASQRHSGPPSQPNQQPCSIFPFFAAPQLRTGPLAGQPNAGQPVQHQYVSSTSQVQQSQQQSRGPTNGAAGPQPVPTGANTSRFPGNNATSGNAFK